jgi:hypothetical protein
MHSCLYEFFRDQGSIIAGLLALAAGILAYLAGISQSQSIREQLSYIKPQLRRVIVALAKNCYLHTRLSRYELQRT